MKMKLVVAWFYRYVGFLSFVMAVEAMKVQPSRTNVYTYDQVPLKYEWSHAPKRRAHNHRGKRVASNVTHESSVMIVLTGSQVVASRAPAIQTWLPDAVAKGWEMIFVVDPQGAAELTSLFPDAHVLTVSDADSTERPMLALPSIAQKFVNSPWFVMIDDDSLPFVPSLELELEQYEEPFKVPHYIGSDSEYGGPRLYQRQHPRYAFGGGGIVMSSALIAAVFKERGSVDRCFQHNGNLHGGDASIGACIYNWKEEKDIFSTNHLGFHQFDFVGGLTSLDRDLWFEACVTQRPPLCMHHLQRFVGNMGFSSIENLTHAYKEHNPSSFLKRICFGAAGGLHEHVCLTLGLNLRVYDSPEAGQDAKLLVTQPQDSCRHLTYAVPNPALMKKLKCTANYMGRLNNGSYLYQTRRQTRDYFNSSLCAAKEFLITLDIPSEIRFSAKHEQWHVQQDGITMKVIAG